MHVINSISYFANRNEQLRDGLLSLVHSYSQLENKLDRHEQRERALGEIIKRGLQTLQKGQKIFEPMRGTFSRLDERIGQIETILLGQDEKFNEQQTKLNKALDLIDKWVGSQDKAVSNSNDVDSNKLTELSNQVEDLSVNVKELRKELDSLASKHDGVSKVSQESFTELGTNLSKKLEQNADAIAKIQEKIGSSKSSGSSNNSWEDAISKELQHIKSNIGVARPCSDNNGEIGSTTDKDFFIGLNNQTLDAIGDMRHEVLTASDKNQLKTTTKLKETATAMETSANDILKSIGESSCDGVSNAIADVKQNINELHKLEQMLAQMGDNVLSIKRGMEFNVHAITLEVSDAIKLNSKELNQTINNQFEAINQTILTNHNGALTNLTTKIETEISQVWRQIGIMYQEVSSSKDALNKLQELTEVYSNGTFTTMDSMEGKVLNSFP